MVDKVFHVEYLVDSDEYQYTYVYRYDRDNLSKYEKTFKFRSMSDDDIKHNLEVLSKLNLGEKLLVCEAVVSESELVDNQRLYIDNRWFMNIRRQSSWDSRVHSFALIAHTYNLSSRVKCEDLQTYINRSFDGLKKLAETYADPNITVLVQALTFNLRAFP